MSLPRPSSRLRRRARLPLAAATLGLLTLSPLAAAPASVPAADSSVAMPRYPALSPDGKTLVFSYQGDLWSAPSDGSARARRLTAHPAYERRATFSPDGKRIAYNSNRYGQNDVLVMPVDGGETERLTYYSGGSTLQAWSGDGSTVLVTARRELQRRGPAFYTVKATGGKPGRPKPLLAISNLLTGALSPDGKHLVFARGSGDWSRRGYRGSANADIWVYTLATKQFRRLTTFEGQDLWPLWLPDSKSVLYVSERDGTYNLYRQSISGGGPVQITRYKGDGVRNPTVSADGSRAAFEVGDRIATVALNTPNAVTRDVPLAVATDEKRNDLVVETLTGNATEMAATPDGEQIAVVVKGDIFVMDKDGGRAAQVTDAPTRDSDLAWSKDGKTLFFVSTRDGNPELYAVTSADPNEPRLSRALRHMETRLTNTPEPERNPQLSPDGKQMAFVRGRGDLMVGDARGQNARAALKGTNLAGYDWSPDGKWFAVSRSDENFNNDILIMPADGSKPPVNISMHPRDDRSPAWSPDGTKLFWTSERLDHQYDLYYVYLTEEDDQRTSEEWERLREKQKAGSKSAADSRANKPVAIDFEKIHERVRRLTTGLGNETAPSLAPGADGHTWVAFSASGDGPSSLSLIDFVDGGPSTPTPRRVATGGGSRQWVQNGKALLFLATGGTPSSVAPAGGEPRTIRFRARYRYSRSALQMAAFDEAWQILNERFYDPNFHGADWKALHAKYRPMAAAASDPDDFYDVLRLMMGHLNSSHIGVTPGDRNFETESLPTGVLGVVWDENHTGPGLKVARVISGGPADRRASRLRPGDVITAIDGTPVAADTDPDVLLADTVGEQVSLQVTGADGASREVIIRPSSPGQISDLLYNEWVEESGKRVRELSGGRLGYLHVQGMNKPSQDRFEQGLFAEAYGKDGLLIDVRDNGGGSTADYLLTMLTIPRHAFTIPRDGVPGYPQDRLPLYAWDRPAALLINQNSYSNAEIFAHAFNVIDRGPVIGRPTFGAVLSTGAASLIDGSSIRVPGRGWYVLTTGVNQEHTGAAPDIDVDLTPADELAGRDPQLEAAVKALLARAKPVTLPAPQPAK